MTRSPNVFEPPFPMKDEDEEELTLDFNVPAPDVPLRTIVAVEHADADADTPSSVPRRAPKKKARGHARKKGRKKANPLSNSSLTISIRHSFHGVP